jgi:hypothetical protein
LLYLLPICCLFTNSCVVFLGSFVGFLRQFVHNTCWKIAFFNPSSHGSFFPRHDTASGHIEPGISGHMRPGRVTAYPFSPPPHLQLSQGPRHSLYWHHTLQYCLCCLPSWQLYKGIYLLFFICLKKHLSFGLLVPMSWALTPPPHTRYCYEELHAPGQNRGGDDMAGPIFST